MKYNKLYKKIERYVTGLFLKIQHPSLTFHNLQHTQKVVQHTKEISDHLNLSEKELFIIFATAWFHDCGYLLTKPSNHEMMSCESMKEFMKTHLVNQTVINKISKCIMATKAPRLPKNLLERIICDADTYHLGTKEFKTMNKRMWREEILTNDKADLINFNIGTIRMLNAHRFYTKYCKHLLEKGKFKNLNHCMLK